MERKALATFIDSFDVIPIDEKIAMIGGLFCRDYRKSHGVGLADSLVAATAKMNNLQLVTMNRKHYPMLRTVTVPYKKRANRKLS